MRKLLFVFAISFCIPVTLFAQNRTIKGNVTDDNGKAAVSVNVTVKGNKKEIVQTDKDGNFSIAVKETGPISLVFSSAEFESKTVAVTDDANVSVKLKQSVTTQDEVIVLSYGENVKKKYLNTTVSSVDKTQLKDVPVNSAAEALTGRLAGVQITTDEGEPGADATINIRGKTSITQDGSPLYVVDGVRVEDGLNSISPQDIDNVVVLKDAAATAIYGASGANGVILITTKSGKNTKGKTSITYNGFVGISQLPKELSVMDPYNFVAYQWERDHYTSAGDSNVVKPYATSWDSVVKYKNWQPTDWQHILFGRNAFQQSHTVNFSGGNDNTQFSLSLSDNEQDGIMLNTGYNRKLASFKLDQKINSKAKVGFNVRYNLQRTDGAGTSDPGTSSLNNLRHSIRYTPILLGVGTNYYDPIIGAETAGNSLSLINPLLLQYAQYRENYLNIVNVNGYFQYGFTKNITFKSTVGFETNSLRQDAFDDTITINSQKNGAQPLASITNSLKSTFDNSNVLTLNISDMFKKFNEKNDLNVILGQELYLTYSKSTNITTKYFPVGISPKTALANMNLVSPPPGAAPQPYPTSLEVPSNVASFFGKLNYAYDKKYFLSYTFRADGTSRFEYNPDRQWGYFNSIQGSWKIINENFMKNVNFLSDLKLRASIGQAGNNRIPEFQYLTQYTTTNTYYGLNDILVTGYGPSNLGNDYLQWELTTSKNIGLDVSLLKDRINFTTDVYWNKTTKLLIDNPSVPTNTGYTHQLQNIGTTTNNGIEFQVGAIIIQKKKLNWNANFNISFNSNKIADLGGALPIPISSGAVGTANDFIIQVGQPVGAMYGYVSDGFYKTSDFTDATFTKLKPGVANSSAVTGIAAKPGTMKLKDITGDTLVTVSDRTIIGNPNPKFFGGLNQQFSYKGFDLSVFVNFSYGNQVLNANKIEFTNGYTPGANMLSVMNKRWVNIDANGNQVTDSAQLAALNTNAQIWSPLVTSSTNAFFPVSWAIEDASFIRINNITLGYTIPGNKLFKKAGINKMRFYFTVNNLAVITSYSGYDPEVNTRRSTPATPAVDYSAYPRSRTYLFGVNLSL